MKRVLRVVIPVLAVITLLAFSIPVFGATTADVTITATPTYIAMTLTDGGTNTWAIGAVAASSTVWYTSAGSAMTEPAVDGDAKITITNTGSVAEDFKVHAHNFTGGVGWTVAASVGADTVVIGAFKTGDANKAAVLKLTTSDQSYKTNIAAAGTVKGGLYLDTGTFTDGAAKSTTLTYTAEQHT